MTATTESGAADWRTLAACRRADPDVFFLPADPQAPAYEIQAAAAKAVCAGCPVRRECLDYALATSQKHGVWGGQTEAERHLELRRQARRRRRAAA